MGYYVNRNYINVRLRKKFGDRVLEAVNSLFDENGEPVRSDAGECQYDGGKVVSRNYSWVQRPGSRGNFPSLETALKDWWHELEDSEEAGFWERGLNENTNGLIRQYLSKSADYRTLTIEQVRSIMKQLNNRPRKCLGFKTPNQLFSEINPPVALTS